MENIELENLFKELKEIFEKNNLKNKGIKLPNLFSGNNYSKNSLVLLYLFKNFKQRVTKEELTIFVKKYYPKVNDVQQARHLGAQKGWYILSGTRGDSLIKLNPGEYMLYSLENSYPDFTEGRREINLENKSWEDLKKYYNNRCVTCGSLEGTSHYINSGTITKLQKGHMDPNLPLDLENTIPQCDWCNRQYKGVFYFNNKGRVSKINDPKIILKSPETVQKKMFELLKSKFNS